MARYKHLFFVCGHRRESEDERGSCAARGSGEVVEVLKERVHALGLRKTVRVVESGCLNYCARGVTVLGLSEGEEECWYSGLTPQNAEEFLLARLEDGEVEGSWNRER